MMDPSLLLLMSLKIAMISTSRLKAHPMRRGLLLVLGPKCKAHKCSWPTRPLMATVSSVESTRTVVLLLTAAEMSH